METSSREPTRVVPFRSRPRDDEDSKAGQSSEPSAEQIIPSAEQIIPTVMASSPHPIPQALIQRSLLWDRVIWPRKPTFKAQATLPTKILEIIFEELQKSSSLATLRLVSVQFNEIAIPILYRHVTLTDAIVTPYSLSKYLFIHTISQLKVAHDVRFYTRHILIYRFLYPHLLKELLRTMKDLRGITWSQWDQTPRQVSTEKSRDQLAQSNEVFQAIRSQLPDLVYSVENLDINSLNTSPLLALPTSNLVSCKFAEWVRSDDLSDGREEVLELLQGRPGLETLHLVSSHARATFPNRMIRYNKRLPAIKELFLDGYDWLHSPEVAVKFWDWSRVTRLELARVSIIRFLRTVEPENLLQLQHFVTDGHCPSKCSGEASGLMRRLVGEIHALEKLDLTYQFPAIKHFPQIAKHSHTLRSLRLRDYEGLFGPKFICSKQYMCAPGLSSPILATLQLSCLGLMELVTDFCSETKPTEIIQTIARFRNLRRLMLFSRKPFRYTQPDEAALRTNQLAVRAMILPLLRTKEGAKFEMVVVGIEMFLMEGIYDASWFGIYTHTYERSERTIEGDLDCHTFHQRNEE